MREEVLTAVGLVCVAVGLAMTLGGYALIGYGLALVSADVALDYISIKKEKDEQAIRRGRGTTGAPHQP